MVPRLHPRPGAGRGHHDLRGAGAHHRPLLPALQLCQRRRRAGGLELGDHLPGRRRRHRPGVHRQPLPVRARQNLQDHRRGNCAHPHSHADRHPHTYHHSHPGPPQGSLGAQQQFRPGLRPAGLRADLRGLHLLQRRQGLLPHQHREPRPRHHPIGGHRGRRGLRPLLLQRQLRGDSAFGGRPRSGRGDHLPPLGHGHLLHPGVEPHRQLRPLRRI